METGPCRPWSDCRPTQSKHLGVSPSLGGTSPSGGPCPPPRLFLFTNDILPGGVILLLVSPPPRIMRPDDANVAGNVHGGTILKMIEEAGAIISTRHCNSQNGVGVGPAPGLGAAGGSRSPGPGVLGRAVPRPCRLGKEFVWRSCPFPHSRALGASGSFSPVSLGQDPLQCCLGWGSAGREGGRPQGLS